jgi:parallel beta-helix repeat protein
MKHLTWGIVALVGIAVASWGANGSVRGPITILGNGDLTAENGVISGSGTVGDPYVIAGWEIEAGEGSFYGVKVENVTVPVVLRGLIVRGAAESGGAAIRIGFSEGAAIEGCVITDSINGIDVVSSTAVTLRDCVLYVSGRGLRVLGETAEEYRHTIDESNLLNGYSIVYVHGRVAETIEGRRTTHLTVADSQDVTITNNDVINGDGIQLAFVTDATVTDNEVYRVSPVLTEHGIHLYRSTGNLVSGNSLRNNNLAGIQLSLSTDNEIADNELLANDRGIHLVASDENRIARNVLFANVTGIDLVGGSSANVVSENIIYHENTRQGIALELATANRIERNVITDAEIGLVLESEASENDLISNTVVAGGFGVLLSGTFNKIERNLFSQQARGILFPESLGETMTRGNTVRGNVLADNGQHVYTCLNSTANEFAENVFLHAKREGTALILDHGTGNHWSIDGVGNYWGGEGIEDENEDGYGDSAITVYPSGAKDEAPIVAIDSREAGIGVVGAMDEGTVIVDLANGAEVEIPVVRADEGCERWVGFRGFPEELLEGFPGILFVYEGEADRRFTMATVWFDIDIAFFDSEGRLVGRREPMTANSEDLYTADEPFQYALELPAGSLAELGIGADSRMRVP